MLIVSDTSPIINLAVINHLHLLPDLFSEIIIPTAVYDEIVTNGQGLPGSKEIASASWVKVVSSTQLEFVEELKKELDSGEAEAIAVAIELKADYLLMDEMLGRNVAVKHSLKPLGILGIFIRAKRKQSIPLVQPLMDKLISEANFFIDKKLYQYVLQLAGE